MKIGHGYDVHKFGSDKTLMLGCTEIAHTCGLIAHSDGDVVCHALCDALLGAAGSRDIGFHFPDNDAEFKDISGAELLGRVKKIINSLGFVFNCADITIVAEKPRLSPYIEEMRANIAKALGAEVPDVNVKATTEEGLGIAGNGIACHAVCLLEKEQ